MKRKIVSVLVCGCLLAAGCTGPFRLTKSVHEWQTGFDNQWVDELAFLGCVILPVYGLSTLVDAILLNSIEFWTGDNPVGYSSVTVGEGVEMALQADGAIQVTDGQRQLRLQRSDQGVTALDAEGKVIYRAVAEGQAINVYDAEGRLIARSAS